MADPDLENDVELAAGPSHPTGHPVTGLSVTGAVAGAVTTGPLFDKQHAFAQQDMAEETDAMLRPALFVMRQALGEVRRQLAFVSWVRQACSSHHRRRRRPNSLCHHATAHDRCSKSSRTSAARCAATLRGLLSRAPSKLTLLLSLPRFARGRRRPRVCRRPVVCCFPTPVQWAIP